MKTFLKSKFGIALVILLVAGSIVYLTTWANKSWLVDNIIDKGGAEDTAENRTALNMKTPGALRSQLKSLM